MEKYIVWYRLLLKAWMKKKGSWIQLAGMVLVILLIAQIKLPDVENITIGICNEDGAFAEDVIEILKGRGSVFRFKQYEDSEEMKEAVIAGKLESGFVFKEGMEKRLESSRKKELITCITTPLATKAAIARETVFAAFLERYSEKILLEEQPGVFGEKDAEVSEALLEKNREFLEGDQIFRIDFEEAKSARKVQVRENTVFPMRGMTALLIFVMVLLHRGRKFEQKDCAVEKALTVREAEAFELIRYLAGTTIPGVAGIILLLYAEGKEGILKETAGMLLLLLLSALWVSFAGKLFQNSITYASWIMTLVIANLLLCPIFVDLSEYIPAIAYINNIFPLGIYLKLFSY